MCHKSTSWTSAYTYMWLTTSDAKVLLTAHVFNPHMLLTITLVNDIFLRETSHILLRITLVNDIFLRETSHILLRITLVNDIFLRETSHILLRITLVNDIFWHLVKVLPVDRNTSYLFEVQRWNGHILLKGSIVWIHLDK